MLILHVVWRCSLAIVATLALAVPGQALEDDEFRAYVAAHEAKHAADDAREELRLATKDAILVGDYYVDAANFREEAESPGTYAQIAQAAEFASGNAELASDAAERAAERAEGARVYAILSEMRASDAAEFARKAATEFAREQAREAKEQAERASNIAKITTTQAESAAESAEQTRKEAERAQRAADRAR